MKEVVEHHPAHDQFLFSALAQFGADLGLSLAVCPDVETWHVWHEVLLSERLEAALGDPEIGSGGPW